MNQYTHEPLQGAHETPRPNARPRTFARVASSFFFLVGICLLAFLGFWYFELVLWIIFAPFTFATLHLARRLWTPSTSLPRAVIVWAASVAWTLTAVLMSFKKVTIVGGAVATLIAVAAAWSLYIWSRRLIRRQQ